MKIKIKIMWCLLAIFSVPALAGTQAKIDKILIYEAGNLLYVYPTGGVQNPPACHGGNGDYLSYKMSRPMAKEYLSVLLTAFAAQKLVNFSTTGTCVDQSVSETIRYLTVHK